MGIAKFLLNKDNLGEKRGSKTFIKKTLTETKNIDLSNELKTLKPELDFKYNQGDHARNTIANFLIQLYCEYNDVPEIEAKATDVAEWIDDFGGTGGIILNFIDSPELYKKPGYVVGLARADEKFAEATKQYAAKVGIINKDGGGVNEKGFISKLSTKEILNAVLNDMNRTATLDPKSDKEDKRIIPKDKNGNELTTNDSEYWSSNFPLDHIDYNLLKDTVEAIRPIYKSLSEAIKKDFESEIIEDSSTTEAESDAPTVKVEIPEEKPSEEVVIVAHNSNINNLIHDVWNLIADVNSEIATLEYDYQDNKEEIITLLNDVVDSLTINIGTLHKASYLVDSEAAELIATGEAKAEQKVGE